MRTPIHPPWYYSHFDSIFGRGASYRREVRQLSALADFSGAHVQELGAGTGNHAAFVLELPLSKLDLVDCDPTAVSILRRRFETFPNVKVQARDGFGRFPARSFDIVYCMFSVVLQGVESARALEQRLIAVRKRLKSTGVFLFEAIDADVSERRFPDSVKSIVYRELSAGDSVAISSHYDSYATTVRYSGFLQERPMEYEARMLRVNRRKLLQIVSGVFGSEASAVGLDKQGRRVLVRAQKV